jgi:hypothetical protein
MTLADVREIADYWAEHPPVHLLLAAFIGFKPEPTIEGGGDWATSLPPAPGIVSGQLPANLPEPIFDFDALMRMQ